MIDSSGRVIDLSHLCGDQTSRKRTSSPLVSLGVPSQTLTAREIAGRSLGAVVQIETEDGLGTGFFISNQGLLLTNAHVVGNTKKVTVVLNKKWTIPGWVIRKANDSDLAIVKVDTNRLGFLDAASRPKVLPICYSHKIDVGENVVVIGNPGGLKNSVTGGIVSAIRTTKKDDEFGLRANIKLLQIDAAINPGNSGGPVLDEYGSVIGVVSMKRRQSEGIAIAIPIKEAVNRFQLNIPNACGIHDLGI
jgi:S1-C subfamily serine protease